MRSGAKTVELRRHLPETILMVYVYESSPVRRITGYLKNPRIERCSLPELWEKTKDCSGVSKEEYDVYFKGKEEGYGIFFESFVPCDFLLSDFGLVTPPQSFAYAN